MSNTFIPLRLLTVNEFIQSYRVGRSTVYKLISDGTLRTTRIRGRRLIPVESAEALVSMGSAADSGRRADQ